MVENSALWCDFRRNSPRLPGSIPARITAKLGLDYLEGTLRNQDETVKQPQAPCNGSSGGDFAAVLFYSMRPQVSYARWPTQPGSWLGLFFLD